MLKKLKLIYQRERLEPSLIGAFVNPFYYAKRELGKAVKKFSGAIAGKVLDVGCGQKPYRAYFKCSEYIGLELDTIENRLQKKADIYYDGKTFPFACEEFDSIVANEVMEHVFNPEQFLNEINRVLKNGGHFLITVPFVWDEHEQPYDYARYSSFGLFFLLEKHGFKIIKSEKTLCDIRILFQLFFAYLYKKIYTNSGIINSLLNVFLVFPLVISGEILNFVCPKNSDFYLDNVVLAQKIHNEPKSDFDRK